VALTVLALGWAVVRSRPRRTRPGDAGPR
jgi:hypothetical protein